MTFWLFADFADFTDSADFAGCKNLKIKVFRKRLQLPLKKNAQYNDGSTVIVLLQTNKQDKWITIGHISFFP